MTIQTLTFSVLIVLIFWVVTPCSFEGPYSFHLQDVLTLLQPKRRTS
uniref:Uncharacterized protein n=1 Tax=Coptotermes formosanus TaxID=36987 RepID=R4UJ75_COPFO|nr:hypothetical protein [Coptotermes formosanus]